MRVRALLSVLPIAAIAALLVGILADFPESSESGVSADPTWALTDAFGDGTPDFMRLDSRDSEAFRAWFTFLAESIYFLPSNRLPAEISDCAALLRFAYRESLRNHDSDWANAVALDILPALPSVSKYRYPATPLAAGIFRIRPGVFTESDLSDGTFAQFADAETLRRLNTHFVSRDIRAARPGDLLFFRQLEQDMPNHAMIYLGPSRFEAEPNLRMVYHTGPIGSTKGEMRRPLLDELLNHREPRWRPVPANGNFLGVYRWNILR